VRAAVDGNLLPLIVFITIFAVAAAALPDEKRHALTDLADVATQALIRIVRWVLLLAPLGIFAIVAGAVAQFGVDLIKAMLVFILTVIAGLAVLITVVLLPVVALVARLGARRYLRPSGPPCSWRSRPRPRSPRSPSCSKPRRATCGSRARWRASCCPGREHRPRRQRAVPGGRGAVRGPTVRRPAGLGGAFQAGAAVFLASLTVASVPSASIVSLVPAFTATGLPSPACSCCSDWIAFPTCSAP